MKKSGKKKRAQMQLSFGMIFSIILIIIFIAFAVYAIYKFMGFSDSMKIGKFIDGLKTSVDRMWKSSQGSQVIEYSLPTKIQYACFADFSSQSTGKNKELHDELEIAYHGDENLVFYPVGSARGIDSSKIEHIDIEKITQDENPYCITNTGKIKMTLKKNFGENLIIIER